MPKTRSRSARLSPGLRRQLAAIRACDEAGETLTAYATRHGLSVQALYQAKKRARELGVLPPHRRTRRGPPERPVRSGTGSRFVEAVPRAEAPASRGVAWRVQLPSGSVLESGTPLSFDETLRLVEALGATR
ncbi:MAG: helix-turn-helix domain-containing protein [Proteobacteria bacterium]|nr:helix-turn-helix domain-containing protein [Pseudomonadota bacterium]